MKLAHLALLSALFLLPNAAPAAPKSSAKKAAKKKTPSPPVARWAPSMSAALAESKRTGKPILVDFHTSWCGWCKVLNEKTYPHPTFVKEAKNWVLVSVDAEKSPALAEKYGVTGYPTIVFLRSDGSLVQGLSGFRPAADMVKEMRAAYKTAAEGLRT